ncbi:30S ribosomal protein S3 [Candidatus Nomurabacteria bacterium RIFCSPLOWO2_01_FULL_33_24]|uniref:Small ribosomal subunit protein uS3 n=1 Tax=Candidatus Nomurabacteria bacterium RIFCSPLOWO2_01_FULL_33_24 TaxID=1801765 RepID=A0A1F6X225_9BACT|nr:MAG: 30S ribosomal protein S3 [Candidatus Nomurabacteria bacterium RIFCSPLOWO2_01_FULL_33_24]
MTKTVHPYAHRLVILRDWKSRWFSNKKKYKDFLRADVLIRKFLEKRLRGFYVSSIEIERSRKFSKIIIKTSRPGMIIGRNGEGATKLKEDLLKIMKKNEITISEEFKLDIIEVISPDSDASLVAYSIVEAMEKRLPYRRVIKQALEKVMAVREVKGARIVVAGRLGGTEIARTEGIKDGNIPLQTLRADIDFARERARLPYGTIGIKVWIYKGEVFNDKKK